MKHTLSVRFLMLSAVAALAFGQTNSSESPEHVVAKKQAVPSAAPT